MASRDAVRGVQESRKRLLSKESSGELQMRSQELVADLEKTLNLYLNTDSAAAGTLNNQIPPA